MEIQIFAIWLRISRNSKSERYTSIKLNISSTINLSWVELSSNNVSYGAVATRGVHYKQTDVAFFEYFCSSMCDKRHLHRRDVFIFLFLVAVSQRLRWAYLHPIFQEDGKWAACNRKLSVGLWTLQGGGREVQKGHFRFWPSFIKCCMVAKRICLSKKRKLWILAG